MRIKNTKSVSVASISGTLTSSDPYIQILTPSVSFPIAYAGYTITSTTAARFSVSPDCPDNHQITFYMNGNSSAGSWSTVIQHTVKNADLDYVQHTFGGATILYHLEKRHH